MDSIRETRVLQDNTLVLSLPEEFLLSEVEIIVQKLSSGAKTPSEQDSYYKLLARLHKRKTYGTLHPRVRLDGMSLILLEKEFFSDIVPEVKEAVEEQVSLRVQAP